MKTLSNILFALAFTLSGCSPEEENQVCSCLSHIEFHQVIPANDTGDTIVDYSKPVQLNAPPGSNYSWEPSFPLSCPNCTSACRFCQNPIFWSDTTTTFVCTYTDTNGLASTYSYKVVVNSLESIYVPNIFTPNGNGVNDILNAYGISISSFTLKVMDGGNTVFQTSSWNQSWDGKINGSFPTSCQTYDVTIDVIFHSGTSKHLTGKVTYLRQLGVDCPDNDLDCKTGNQFDGSGYNSSFHGGEDFGC